MEIKKFSSFLKEDIITEASFSIGHLERAIELLASIGSKYAKAKFGRVNYAPWGIQDFTKSDGTTGTGILFMNAEGEKLRIGYAEIVGFNKKKSQEINFIDYWDSGNFNLGKPTRSVACYPNYNIVHIAKDVMNFAITGTLPDKEILGEDSQVISEIKASEKMYDYFRSLGVTEKEIKEKSAYKIQKELIASGKWNDDEYRGFKSVKTTEKNSVQISIKSATKALQERPYSDPKYVFDDIVDLATIVAKGHQNSLIIAGQAGVGKCVYSEMELEITGLD